MPAGGMGVVAAAKAKRRREEFLIALRNGASVNEAAQAAGWSVGPKGSPAYWKHRQRWPDFRAECDTILARRPNGKALEPVGENAGGPPDDGWDGSFASFRKTFLYRDSPWFHVQAVNVIEDIVATGMRNAGLGPHDPVPPGVDVSFGGQVILLLWPPEHGKTSLWEDADNYFLSRFPWFQITVGSEKQTHSKKVLKQVRNRFEDGVPEYAQLRKRFGPFAPRAGQRANQPWGAEYFDVFKKPRGGSREYSMQAIGMGSAIAGTRTHLLQVDDPQSRKSVNLTPKLVEEFRQDWLSRPGVTGFTVIIMNRVGEEDFPTALINDDIVDHVIKVKAWDAEHGWAWPERYTPGDYARLRRNVGADAWDRNYLQLGTPTKSMTFTDRHFAGGRNPLRSILHPPPKNPATGGPARIGLGLDPGYTPGVSSVTAGALEPTKLRLLDCDAHDTFTAPEQIMRLLEDFLITYTVNGVSAVEFVVVETKAFQKGFINDDRYRELQHKYGFRTIPHLTGEEKTDEDIGIPQMALSWLRGEIDVPDGDDVSRARFEPFYREHKRWRPKISGAKLKQDRVMSTWFLWMYWRRLRRVSAANPENFRFRGLPSR